MRIRCRYLHAVLALAACGPTVSDDDGGGSGSGGASTTGRDGGSSTGTGGANGDAVTSTSGSEAGASSSGDAESTGRPESTCSDQKPGECNRLEGCENVTGSDVRPGEARGDFYCSDLAFPFACALSNCKRFSGILCEEDSDDMVWVIEVCIPEGWVPCPNAECTASGS